MFRNTHIALLNDTLWCNSAMSHESWVKHWKWHQRNLTHSLSLVYYGENIMDVITRFMLRKSNAREKEHMTISIWRCWTLAQLSVFATRPLYDNHITRKRVLKAFQSEFASRWRTGVHQWQIPHTGVNEVIYTDNATNGLHSMLAICTHW